MHDLVHAKTPYIAKNLQTYLNHNDILEQRATGGTMVMFDQEPLDVDAYCMVTKEFLRQDNADIRLTPKSFDIGLATAERMEKVKQKEWQYAIWV